MPRFARRADISVHKSRWRRNVANEGKLLAIVATEDAES